MNSSSTNYNWKQYWRSKRLHSKEKNIPYALTKQDEDYLTHTCPDIPGISKGKYHLGRLDHSKGYYRENVEWQTASHNTAEVWERGNKRWKNKVLFVYLNCDTCGEIFETRGVTYRGRIKRGQTRFFCIYHNGKNKR